MSKKKSSPAMLEAARDFLPFLLLQLDDQDLERLERDFPDKEEGEKVLLTMLTAPREEWERLGVPPYLLKYQLMSEEEEEEEW